MLKIAIIIGTRPEIIKMSPIIRACDECGQNYFIIHTGQHYSYEMDKIFFNELELKEAKYNLDVGSGTHGAQTGQMLEKIENILIEEKPDIVLVQGDTNSVLAGALAASKLQIKVGHVEAGLRSHDRAMPEEINRVIADHISDYLFVPTSSSKDNLIREGIDNSKIFITGNTIVDSVHQNLEISLKKMDVLKHLNIESKRYFLITLHRAESVDSPIRLKSILNSLGRIFEVMQLEIIFPMHPRTEKMIQEFGLTMPNGVLAIKPLGFLEFLQLESNARLVLTDSGGIQEETCILNVPCITLRNNTERPETVDVGSNILAGYEEKAIIDATERMMESTMQWNNPFGDGNASNKIIEFIQSLG